MSRPPLKFAQRHSAAAWWRGVAGAVGLVLAAAGTEAADEQRLYRWVDDQGRVHYSDTLPPDQAGQRREIKTPEGATVGTVEPPPTREQLEAEAARRQAEEQARAQREAVERRRREHDRMLLMTFTSVEEMQTARDERLGAIESQIGLVRSRIDKLQKRREQLRQEAATLERTGRGNPAQLYRELEQIERSIRQNRSAIEDKRDTQARIRLRFSEDIDRFRELLAERGAGQR